MRDMAFFEGVLHRPLAGEGPQLYSPTFYYDLAQMWVAFSAPLERIQELLPAPWLHPLRPTRRTGTVVIAAYQYRDCDVGPYNEVGVAFPVSLHRRLPVLAGLRPLMLHGGTVFVWQLPVTTPLARELGIEFAGFPKFLADIDFAAEAGRARCRLEEGGRHILTVSMQHRPPRRAPSRLHIEPITVKEGRVLRSMVSMSVPAMARTWGSRGLELQLGDHPLADRLRHLSLGRALGGAYAPASQSIFSSALEGWPIAQ